MHLSLLNNTNSHRTLSQISLSLGILGLVVGFLVGYGILDGDAQGRVNLLFLLMLFAFLPVLGLILSIAFLLTGGRRGLAGWILELPLLPQHLAAEVLNLGLSGSRKSWLFYQTQILTLNFAFGGLLVYLLLLIGSDISFVWRSTLLEAADLFPVLNALAMPWFFWSEAQPSLQMLQQTQDFRLSIQSADAPVLGQWWKYIFAAQCTYNLLPRTIMLIVSRNRYLKVSLATSVSSQLKQQSDVSQFSSDNERRLAPVVHTISVPYFLLDWANTPEFCLEHLNKGLGKPVSICKIEPLLQSTPEEVDGESANHSAVVLVKSWEPPLGELRDYLSSLSGQNQKFILPLDWDQNAVKPMRDIHLSEWRRFCATLDGWQLLQLDETT